MKRTRITALALALGVAAPGCSSTQLSGTYRPASTNVSEVGETEVLAKSGQWLFFWGLLDSGTLDLENDMKRDLRPYEAVVNLEVKNKLSVGGFLLWLITAGIVSHHKLTARGQLALAERATPPTTPAQPAPPPPAR